MTAMFPDSGVPWQEARNSLPNPDTTNCDELWYSTSRCQPRFDPAAANAMLAELINLVNRGEVSYDCSRLDNVERAARYIVQRGLSKGTRLIGGPSSYTATLDPPATRYNDYMVLTIVPAVTNDGAASVNVDGIGSHPIVRNDGSPVIADDLRKDVPLEICYFAGSWYLISTARSQSASSFPEDFRYEVHGTYNFVVPPDVRTLEVHVYGAGGGGGGAIDNMGGGGGGGGGGYARKICHVEPNSTHVVIIGLGGVGGRMSNGAQGGTSSFGNFCAATGGPFGHYPIPPYPGQPSGSGLGGAGDIGGIGTGGDTNMAGGGGSSGATGQVGIYTGYGGLGGACPGPEGGVGGTMSTGTAGPGIGYGGGGSGGGAAAAAQAGGGDGHDGAVVIRVVHGR